MFKLSSENPDCAQVVFESSGYHRVDALNNLGGETRSESNIRYTGQGNRLSSSLRYMCFRGFHSKLIVAEVLTG